MSARTVPRNVGSMIKELQRRSFPGSLLPRGSVRGEICASSSAVARLGTGSEARSRDVQDAGRSRLCITRTKAALCEVARPNGSIDGRGAGASAKRSSPDKHRSAIEQIRAADRSATACRDTSRSIVSRRCEPGNPSHRGPHRRLSRSSLRWFRLKVLPSLSRCSDKRFAEKPFRAAVPELRLRSR